MNWNSGQMNRKWRGIHRHRARCRWRVNRAIRNRWTMQLARLERKYPSLVRSIIRGHVSALAKARLALASVRKGDKKASPMWRWGKGLFKKLFGSAEKPTPKEVQPA